MVRALITAPESAWDVIRYALNTAEDFDRRPLGTGNTIWITSSKILNVINACRENNDWRSKELFSLEIPRMGLTVLVDNVYSALAWIITADLATSNKHLPEESDRLDAELTYRFARMCALVKKEYFKSEGPVKVQMWKFRALDASECTRFIWPMNSDLHSAWSNLICDRTKDSIFQQHRILFDDIGDIGHTLEARSWRLTDSTGSYWSVADFTVYEFTIPTTLTEGIMDKVALINNMHFEPHAKSRVTLSELLTGFSEYA